MWLNKFSKDTDLICLSKTEFPLIFVSFSILLFMTTSFIMFDEISTSLIRKYMGSQVERNFGFHGGETIINNGGHEVKYFYIQSVEPGGTFEKAGLRPNDIPFFNKGCRFFMLYKTDEAILYTGLNYAKNGKQLTFSVINKEEYDKAIKSDMNYYDYIRKISLIISDENSQN